MRPPPSYRWRSSSPAPCTGGSSKNAALNAVSSSAAAALEALAAELDESATPLINYQQRRQALETWSIDEATWSDLISRLPPVPGPQQPELGDRKRQIASIYPWVQVTSGAHHFAPRPIEAAQPPKIQQAWKPRQNTIWHLMQSSRPRRHYTSLKTELNTLAASLARTIDAPHR